MVDFRFPLSYVPFETYHGVRIHVEYYVEAVLLLGNSTQMEKVEFYVENCFKPDQKEQEEKRYSTVTLRLKVNCFLCCRREFILVPSSLPRPNDKAKFNFRILGYLDSEQCSLNRPITGEVRA